MRVAEHVFVQDGSLRSACYDMAKGECWPLSEHERVLIRTLGAGKNPIMSGLNNSEILTTLISMRVRGWVVAGSPRVKDLNIPFAPIQDKPNRLHHVWLELTGSCNLTCSHCYAESGPGVDRSTELSSQQWLDIVQELLDYKVDIITFMGGEPTIRLDLAESISALVKENSPTTRLRMFSNFSVPSRARAMVPFVKKFGIEIGTAIYGISPSSHDKMTGVPGSFVRTTALIDMMKSEGIPVFVGMYVDLSDSGMKSQCENWLKSIGISNYEVLAPSQVGRGTIKFWRSTKKKNSNNKILSFTSKHLSHSKNGHNCFLDHFAIKPNGEVSPCIMMRNITYGNKKSLSVNEILNTEMYRLASSLSKDTITGCSSCEFRYACFDCRPDAMSGRSDIKRKPACGYDPRLPLGVDLRE